MPKKPRLPNAHSPTRLPTVDQEQVGLIEVVPSRIRLLKPLRPLGTPSGAAELPVVEARVHLAQAELFTTRGTSEQTSMLSRLREITLSPIRIGGSVSGGMISGHTETLTTVSADAKRIEATATRRTK